MLHGAERTAATIDLIERTADDLLLPLVGSTLRSALSVPPPTGAFELEGEGLAFSAAKDSDDGEWIVLRAVNLTDESRPGAWRLGIPIHEARWSRLDETPGDPIDVADGRIEFTAGPRAVVTTLVR
jgi:hypothetical protein